MRSGSAGSAAWRRRARSLLPYNESVTHWQVRAQADNGAIYTCGVPAASKEKAEAAARDLIPFTGAYWFTVLPVPPRPDPDDDP